MGSANTVILVGRLGADPELRYTGEGTAVCKLSLATNRTFKDRDGNRQDRTNWHKVVVWGRTGELCKEWLAKGRQVYVEGRMETRSYEDKENVRRYVTEVISNRIVFLDKGTSRSTGSFGPTSASDVGTSTGEVYRVGQDGSVSAVDDPPF